MFSLFIVPKNSDSVSCSKDFYKENNACLLSCYEFNQDNTYWEVIIEVIVCWTGWFGFITGSMVLVISLLKYRAM